MSQVQIYTKSIHYTYFQSSVNNSAPAALHKGEGVMIITSMLLLKITG
jgi:hypothetical protein